MTLMLKKELRCFLLVLYLKYMITSSVFSFSLVVGLARKSWTFDQLGKCSIPMEYYLVVVPVETLGEASSQLSEAG